MELILAIDGGGTRTRCLAINREGKVLGEHLRGPSNHLLVDSALIRSFSFQGSVLGSCALLRERTIEELSRRQLTLKFLKPRFSPVIGAYLLGRKALGWEVNIDVLADLG